MYKAIVIADSINNDTGNRLTTLELTYPRVVHSEFMTHRTKSRNAASSRAIPNKKMLERIMDDPFVPVYWGKNQSGMQAEQELDDDTKEEAKKQWLAARILMVE